VIRSAIVAGAASVLSQPAGQAAAQQPSQPSQSQREQQSPLELTDSNISLFRCPFRRLPLDDTDKLVKKLRLLGFTQAWAGSFEGLLHRDIAGVNQRLHDECARYPELVPIGSINLGLPAWETDLRRCVQVHQMSGVRVHPNYHGYSLGAPEFLRFLKQATEAGLFVQIASAMEDPRTQHFRVVVPDVDLVPLAHVLPLVPKARVQILNARVVAPQLQKLSQNAGLYFDTARFDGTDALLRLVQQLPLERILFGTHAPFLIPEAALIRTHESGQVEPSTLEALFVENPRQFSRMHSS
jgi:predicted TIM-barrel fold metal-dependent hydrolase